MLKTNVYVRLFLTLKISLCVLIKIWCLSRTFKQENVKFYLLYLLPFKTNYFLTENSI